MIIQSYLKNNLFEGITGKNEFLTLLANDAIDVSNSVLIAIHEPNRAIHDRNIVSKFQDVLQIQFWDIEESFPGYETITKLQALTIRNFILKNKDKKFFVHCLAGVSRSAGVACAIECLLLNNGDVYSYKTSNSDVKNHKRYFPNWKVFDEICKEKL
jgi:predicted protein tyrosine phosphatase